MTDPYDRGNVCHWSLHRGDRRARRTTRWLGEWRGAGIRGLHQHGDQSAGEPQWANDQAAIYRMGTDEALAQARGARGCTHHHQCLLSVRAREFSVRFFLTLCLPLSQGEADAADPAFSEPGLRRFVLARFRDRKRCRSPLHAAATRVTLIVMHYIVVILQKKIAADSVPR